jgi:hypothetical protein
MLDVQRHDARDGGHLLELELNARHGDAEGREAGTRGLDPPERVAGQVAEPFGEHCLASRSAVRQLDVRQANRAAREASEPRSEGCLRSRRVRDGDVRFAGHV